MKRFHLICVIGALLCLGRSVLAQDAGTPTTEDEYIDVYIGLLRQDIQSQAVAIIGEVMQFTPEQAAVFWPLYAEYAKNLEPIGDIRVANIKDYAEHYSDMTDEQAEELISRAIDFQAKRLDLKREYFPKFSDTISPKLAAKFFQVEYQLQLILDLQVSASLPIVQ